jgi:hypothetical protein
LLAEGFDILFSLANEHDWGIADLPEPVEDLASGFPVYPTAVAVRAPLKKSFRFGPNNLVQQIAGFVDVVVFGDNPAALTRFLSRPEATSGKGGDYSALFTTRVAVN